jgi:hypothetical protein
MPSLLVFCTLGRLVERSYLHLRIKRRYLVITAYARVAVQKHHPMSLCAAAMCASSIAAQCAFRHATAGVVLGLLMYLLNVVCTIMIQTNGNIQSALKWGCAYGAAVVQIVGGSNATPLRLAHLTANFAD